MLNIISQKRLYKKIFLIITQPKYRLTTPQAKLQHDQSL